MYSESVQRECTERKRECVSERGGGGRHRGQAETERETEMEMDKRDTEKDR